jgi:thiol-disulfide isomerase/thioredoxin
MKRRRRFGRTTQIVAAIMATCGATALLPAGGWAQGCILARQSAPVLGGLESPYLSPNEWQVFATYRTLRADTHFLGTTEDVRRQRRNNFVVNKQQLLDIGLTRAITRRWNLTLGVPVLTYGSWSVPVPVIPPGQRQVQSASGLGDISLTARYWLLDTDTNFDGNLELGLGLKAPTGDSDARDRFPDARGRVFSVMPVDQSIQPGDGGWGINLDAQGFKRVGSATVFGSVTYLISPRNTNNTESSALFLCGGTLPPGFKRYKFNSVPDQYLARAGVTMPIPKAKGFSVSLAARMEGVPVRDLIRGSDGFRRPGYTIFIEPGISYATGAHTFSVSAPVATQRNVQRIVGGYRPDGTLADYVLLASYSYRWGGSKKRGAMVKGDHAVAPAGAQLYDEKADGKKQIRDAVAQAKASGKRVLLHFGANWCGPCHQLHELFEKDPMLSKLIKDNYVVANIDLNEGHNDAVRARYGNPKQETIPFLVILDAEGKALASPLTETLLSGDKDSPFSIEKLAALLQPAGS